MSGQENLQAAFDAIIEEMIGQGEGIGGFSGEFTHERSPQNCNLTAALFAVKMLGAEGLRSFYEKGGRFTDQCDGEGRDARAILSQRVEDAVAQQPEQAQRELREAMAIFEEIIAGQGGVIHIAESPERFSRRTTPAGDLKK